MTVKENILLLLYVVGFVIHTCTIILVNFVLTFSGRDIKNFQ